MSIQIGIPGRLHTVSLLGNKNIRSNKYGFGKVLWDVISFYAGPSVQSAELTHICEFYSPITRTNRPKRMFRY